MIGPFSVTIRFGDFTLIRFSKMDIFQSPRSIHGGFRWKIIEVWWMFRESINPIPPLILDTQQPWAISGLYLGPGTMGV